jgi:uncharacterized protein YjiS (DUF1127 family)
MLTTETSLPRPPIYEAELRARHERNLLAHALAHRLAATVSRWLGSLAHKGVQQMRRFANERCQRRAIRTLNKLDDRMLADLGLCRGDIENVVRYGPPWHGTKRTAA